MTRTNSPLHQLIAWATDVADDRTHRQVARRWGSERHSLAGYHSVGQAVRSAWADPELATVLIAELMALPDPDGVATQAAVAIVAPRLASVVARWVRAGVSGCDLEDMESELVAATIEWLRILPGPVPPGAITDLAWARVRNARRRQLRAAGRQVTLDPAAMATETPSRAAAMTVARVVIDGYRSGRLSLPGAQALWATGVAGHSSTDAAQRLGCQPDALRARRSRAIRALAA